MNNIILSDARYFQIIFLTSFLGYGLFFLGWDNNMERYLVTFSVCIITQLIGIYYTKKDFHTLKSAMITTLGLCLLLRSDNIWAIALASSLAIGSKFIIQYQKKHIFNPANFGIILSILITQQTWISPGQWGNGTILLFLIGSLGIAVVTKVQKLDIAFAFLGTLIILQGYRTLIYLGWTIDVLLQSFTSGSLILFTFFMITDPVSTPNALIARVIFGIIVAILTFYLANYQFVNGAAVWALFFVSPLTWLLDYLFRGHRFIWIPKT